MMSKFVYYIASHRLPEQLARLIEAIRRGSPNAQVVVHHDYSKSEIDRSDFEKLGSVHVLRETVAVTWGEFSQVEMSLKVFDWLIANTEFDWLIFLSGQDYPIQPLADTERLMKDSGYDAFIQGDCIMSDCQTGTLCYDYISRYYYRYYKLPKLPFYNALPRAVRRRVEKVRSDMVKVQKVFRKSMRPLVFRNWPSGGVRVGFRFPSPFHGSFRCFKGSTWFSMNRKCIKRIRQVIGENTKLINYYRRTLMPDESFFQTILFNQPRLKILNDAKRFVMWDSDDVSSPEILTTEHFDKIVSSGKHFARKFDLTVDKQIFDMLDHHLGNV